MPDSSRERALRSLRELSDEFKDESRRGSELYSVLFAATYFEHPRAQEWPPVPSQDGRGRFKRPWFVSDANPLLIFYYYGDEATLDRFGRLALHASRALEGLWSTPGDERQFDCGTRGLLEWSHRDLLTRFAELATRLDVSLWLLVVHSLAWQRLGGSFLVANRKIWNPDWNYPYHFTLPYDEDKRRNELSKLPTDSDFRQQIEAEPPPDFFFSELPDNVFRCSIQAISLILDLNTDGSRGATHSSAPVPSQQFVVASREEAAARVPPIIDSQSVVPGEYDTTEPLHHSEAAHLATEQSWGGKPRVSLAEATRRVSNALLKHGPMTIRKLMEVTKVSAGGIHKTEPWKNLMAKQRQEAKSVRTRNLEKPSMDEVASSDDPRGRLEQAEILHRYYWERVPEEKRKAFLDMTDPEKLDAIRGFIEQQKLEAKRLLTKAGLEHKESREFERQIESLSHQDLEHLIVQLRDLASEKIRRRRSKREM